ncbi:MAG: hypothetical protein KJ950_02645 [Proteobacteria bacterium]|nr:hypothetical protein [Pseudomonadota bacterium]MBU1686776.1 hypothetical protein [Pseudomonadota bacterium]
MFLRANRSWLVRSLILIILGFMVYSLPVSGDPATDKLEVAVTDENGIFTLSFSAPLPQPFEATAAVLHNLPEYPKWFFMGINELNTSRHYWAREENFHYLKKDNRELLLFDYDVGFLFFRFRDTLKLQVSKEESPIDSSVAVQAMTMGTSGLLRQGSGRIMITETPSNRPVFSGTISIRPPWYLFILIRKDHVARFLAPRIARIIKNLEEHVVPDENLVVHI